MNRSCNVWLLALAFAGCESVEAPVPAPRTSAGVVDFGNPDLLVETDWLDEHLGDEVVRILDARDEEKYAAGHIPGAIHIARSDLYDTERTPGDLVGSTAQIAKQFGDKGIDEYAHVVVYDEGVSTRAARVFWTLEYYGHPNVSVLNGGITKWLAEGRELSIASPELRPLTFTVRQNPDAISTQEQVEGDLADENVVILDARTDEEFSGEDVRAERGGHVPGAVHVEWTRNFTEGEAPVFKPPFQLAQMYEELGVTRDKRVHAY